MPSWIVQSKRIWIIGIVALAVTLISFCGAGKTVWSYAPVTDSSAHTIMLTGRFYIDTFLTQTVDGLDASISNPTDLVVSILWDESAMVLPDGTSARVIHTGVRIINKAAPQAPTAIAPHSRTTEAIWPSSYVSDSGSLQHIPITPNCTIRLYLTLQDQLGKHTEDWAWFFTKNVTPEPAKAPIRINWWLWGSILFALWAFGTYLESQGY